jgi:hypothetical protein
VCTLLSRLIDAASLLLRMDPLDDVALLEGEPNASAVLNWFADETALIDVVLILDEDVVRFWVGADE